MSSLAQLSDMLVCRAGLRETDGLGADRDRLRLDATTEFLTEGHITPQQFDQHVMGLLRRLTQTKTPAQPAPSS